MVSGRGVGWARRMYPNVHSMPEPITERIADYVRQLRREADASQREMAKRAGLAPGTLARLESGRAADVQLGTIEALAKVAKHSVCLVAQDGVLLYPYPRMDAWRDRAGRKLPAHLDVWRYVPDWWEPWTARQTGPFRYGRDRKQRDRRRAEEVPDWEE